MNLYFVVEGLRTEVQVYQSWLKLRRPKMKRVYDVSGGSAPGDDNYYMIVGHGYPCYLRRIKAAVDDIVDNPGRYDALIICVDTEEGYTLDEKKEEIEALLAPLPETCRGYAIIAQVCIETWFLGNRCFYKRFPEGEELRRFQEHYDVSKLCPEGMPALTGLTRATFHKDYFRLLCRERKTTYSKRKDGAKVVCEKAFLEAIRARRRETGHLESLETLEVAFRELGLWGDRGGLRCARGVSSGN